MADLNQENRDRFEPLTNSICSRTPTSVELDQSQVGNADQGTDDWTGEERTVVAKWKDQDMQPTQRSGEGNEELQCAVDNQKRHRDKRSFRGNLLRQGVRRCFDTVVSSIPSKLRAAASRARTKESAHDAHHLQPSAASQRLGAESRSNPESQDESDRQQEAKAEIRPVWLCMKCYWLQTTSNTQDQGVGALRVATGLRDQSFCYRPESTVFLPHEIQLRIEKEALVILQQTVWKHVHDHWPHAQQERWPEGPGQVSFGRQEFDRDLACFRKICQRGNSESCCNEVLATVISADVFRDVIELRNAASHHYHQTPKAVDDCLKAAHEVAVLLFDQHSATQIRQQRDDGRMAVMHEHSQIVERDSLGQLDDHLPWPPNIERYFASLSFTFEGICQSKCTAAVERAALAWKRRRGWPELPEYVEEKDRVEVLNVEYQARLAAMKSRMVLVAPTAVETEAKSDSGLSSGAISRDPLEPAFLSSSGTTPITNRDGASDTIPDSDPATTPGARSMPRYMSAMEEEAAADKSINFGCIEAKIWGGIRRGDD